MNTNELIAELRRLDPDGTKPVKVAVGTYTTAYPAAYVEPHSLNAAWEEVRIYASLPQGMSISKRKVA